MFSFDMDNNWRQGCSGCLDLKLNPLDKLDAVDRTTGREQHPDRFLLGLQEGLTEQGQVLVELTSRSSLCSRLPQAFSPLGHQHVLCLHRWVGCPASALGYEPTAPTQR